MSRFATMRVVGVATLIAVCVAGCGLALQLVALPRPGKGDVAAARALTWLSRYRESRSQVAVGGRWERGVCLHGWLGKRRGTLLRVSNGAVIEDLPPHTLDIDGSIVRRPVALLQAAGCTKVLADRLATDAEFVGGVRARPVHVNGAAAFAIHFPRLVLYVSRRSGRPLGVRTPWAHGVFRLVAAARA